MSKFVCTPCAPLSQIECRAISDEHLLGQDFAVVRVLNTPGAIPEVLRSASQGSGCSGSRRPLFDVADMSMIRGDLLSSLSDRSVASLSRGVNVHNVHDGHLFLCLSTVRRRSLAPYALGFH